MLWVFTLLVLLSATGIFFAALGPLKATQSARVLTAFALVQYALAAVLLVASLRGAA